MNQQVNTRGPIEFIGIGAARSGSSWIGNVLRMHPDIAISEPKEIRYFNRFQIPVGNDKGRLNPNHGQTLDWYYKRFAHASAQQIRGEISPVYLADPAAAPAIKKAFPEVKLLLCVRNPVKRAYSSYRLHRGLQVIDDMSFEQALEQESVYVDMGMYGRHLKRFLEYFDREKVLVVVFEDLIDDPNREFNRIFEFLGVRTDVDLDYSARNTNESSNMRSKRLHRIAFKVTQSLVNSGLGSVVHALRSVGAHRILNRVNSAPSTVAPLSAKTARQLMQTFADDISELEKLVNIDLGIWKHPQ